MQKLGIHLKKLEMQKLGLKTWFAKLGLQEFSKLENIPSVKHGKNQVLIIVEIMFLYVLQSMFYKACFNH